MKEQIAKNLDQLNKLVIEGKVMEAFERFYHPDVQMQENQNPPTVGKDLNRQRELEFLGNITDFRGATVEGVAIADNISFVIWSYDYSHKHWGERKYTQVSVQNWQDGQIIKEQFFYGN